MGVADKFLKKGQLIVSHHGRASAEKRYVAQHGNGGKDYPLVVLVNRGRPRRRRLFPERFRITIAA